MLHISCRARSACRGLSTWALSPRLPFTAQPLQGVQLIHRTAGPLQCLKPGQAPEDVVKRISKEDVELSFARSGGAGGQNVNKVNTKVDMRVKLDNASWLDPEVKEALEQREKSRINKENEFVVTSQKTRSQADNVEDALEKMQKAIDSAAKAVIPKAPNLAAKKKINKQLKKANENRLQDKKQASQKKSDRKSKIDY